MADIIEIPTNFRLAVDPAIKWLNDNSNPHAYILITPTGAELLESAVLITNVDKHLKD